MTDTKPEAQIDFGGKLLDQFMRVAFEEAKQGMAEGGLPIGAVLVVDGQIVGRGRNRRFQQANSVTRHAEVDCIDDAGDLTVDEYRRAELYTTLSPCEMCSGAILFFNIPKVVIGDNQNALGAEAYLKERGVELVVLNDETCIRMLRGFVQSHQGKL